MKEKERGFLFLCYRAKREYSGLAPQLPSRMSLMSESKRDWRGSGSASLSVCDKPKGGPRSPNLSASDGVSFHHLHPCTLLCVTSWPAIQILLSKWPDNHCHLCADFYVSFGSSRGNVTLRRRKGTAGGRNRMCRVSAFNPGHSSSSDGLGATAFGA